jgi:hypothetical protein
MTPIIDKARMLELAGRCEAAGAADLVLDGMIGAAIRYGYEDIGPEHELEADSETGSIVVYVGKRKVKRFRAPAFTASIDAAMSLVPEGWDWSICRYAQVDDGFLPFSVNMTPETQPYPVGAEIDTEAATPALALCAAALRSLAQGEGV